LEVVKKASKGWNIMQFGLFGMNVTGGLVMTKNPQWKPSLEKIAQRLQMVEKYLPHEPFSFVPISRWKGYSGEKEIAGDAIESICLASYLLSKTKRSKIFGTFSTFAYEPELVAHVAARLNIEFNNRFAINIVGGWKKDEFDYFKKDYLDSSQKIYEFASYWTDRFKDAEAEHLNTLTSIIDGKIQKKKTEIMCAAFSKEGREFTKKYADSMFTTITKTHLSKNVDFSQVSSAISLFVGNTISEAEEYYKFLLETNVDQKAADNFIDDLSYSDPFKGYFSKKNVHLVKSGAGIEELITDVDGLKSFLLEVRKLGMKSLLFALPDYDKSLKILIDCIKETNG